MKKKIVKIIGVAAGSGVLLKIGKSIVENIKYHRKRERIEKYYKYNLEED